MDKEDSLTLSEILSAYNVAENLFIQGWRAKVIRTDMEAHPVSRTTFVYEITNPKGEKFESHGFVEMFKKLNGPIMDCEKAYNFCNITFDYFKGLCRAEAGVQK